MPANAVECGNCGTITTNPDATECSVCGTDDYLMPVAISDCPAEHPADCDDETHHFGIGKHIEMVATGESDA